jgi:hypothetical protein
VNRRRIDQEDLTSPHRCVSLEHEHQSPILHLRSQTTRYQLSRCIAHTLCASRAPPQLLRLRTLRHQHPPPKVAACSAVETSVWHNQSDTRRKRRFADNTGQDMPSARAQLEHLAQIWPRSSPSLSRWRRTSCAAWNWSVANVWKLL